MNQLILEYAIDPLTVENISKELLDYINEWRLTLEEDVADIDEKNKSTLNYFITTEEDEHEGIFASRISPMFETIEDLNEWFINNKTGLEAALHDLYSTDDEGIFTQWVEDINKESITKE